MMMAFLLTAQLGWAVALLTSALPLLPAPAIQLQDRAGWGGGKKPTSCLPPAMMGCAQQGPGQCGRTSSPSLNLQATAQPPSHCSQAQVIISLGHSSCCDP